ncbi:MULTISPECIES: histidine phosphotransferase family protein [unclassified Sulfitobacter]|jgi:histidine phosphotransferase ChpT|uniref:histidine phosphotransferase family protein n=1 Tax=unclassified Sulfitobacter TaxID=196795 RepID=UPI00159452A4|nr:histidine phosphotransferase family protein [Sulfitobacter sp. HGT1]MBQ0804437.1 histidine phosphotransferase [Sulfitobacter sp.]
MPESEIEFAALIGSRICHDLISPIGAVNNGLELLSMTGVSPSPELALIGDSVDSASARIRFFRVAFGAAANQMLGAGEINAILRDYYRGSRWSVEWAPVDPQKRIDVRMCFLALLCLETGMPYGGSIRVETSGDRWVLRGQTEKLNIDPDLWAVLATPTCSIKLCPAQVQFGLLPVLARDAGQQITSNISQTEITLSF